MTNISFKSLLAASALALVLGFSGMQARAETLNEAVSVALEQHPSVLSAIANRDASAQARRAERSGYFPQLNVNAGAGRIYGDNATSRGLSVTRGSGYSWMGEGGASLSQLIYDFAGTSSRVNAAGALEESAAFKITDIREDVALRAALAYLDVLRAEEAVAAIAGHEALLSDYITRIRNMVAQGAAEESLLVQAEDIKAQLDRTRVENTNQLVLARADYKEVIGTMPSAPLMRPAIAADLIPDDVEGAVMAAMTDHPGLRSAEGEVVSAEHQIKAERSVLYPRFMGELSYYEKDQKDMIGGEVADGRAVVRMNWDYSLGGAEVARMREAHYRHAESRANFADRQRQVEAMIRKAYAQLSMSEQEQAILAERLSLNQRLVDNNKAQFEGARLNIFQLLQTENNLFAAKLSEMSSAYRTLAARYAVLASMGRLQDALMVVTPGVSMPPPAPNIAERAISSAEALLSKGLGKEARKAPQATEIVAQEMVDAPVSERPSATRVTAGHISVENEADMSAPPIVTHAPDVARPLPESGSAPISGRVVNDVFVPDQKPAGQR